MKTTLRTLTHAQARFYRRMLNSRGSGQPSLVAYIGTKGQPIPGELSAVELAHKQRRSLRRLANLDKRRKKLEVELMMKVREHQQLKEGETAKEAALKATIRELQNRINRIVQSLGRLNGEQV